MTNAAIALLRGINVGGKNLLPMAELRELAHDLGLRAAQTYIQSGNLVFATGEPLVEVEAELERQIAARFGFAPAVIVRSRTRWAELAAASAFEDAEVARPNLLHVAMSKSAPRHDAAERLAGYATAGERIVMLPDGLWIDYPAGAGKSKLTPAVLDRCVGSPVTARNWRTVQKIAELLDSVL